MLNKNHIVSDNILNARTALLKPIQTKQELANVVLNTMAVVEAHFVFGHKSDAALSPTIVDLHQQNKAAVICYSQLLIYLEVQYEVSDLNEVNYYTSHLCTFLKTTIAALDTLPQQLRKMNKKFKKLKELNTADTSADMCAVFVDRMMAIEIAAEELCKARYHKTCNEILVMSRVLS